MSICKDTITHRDEEHSTSTCVLPDTHLNAHDDGDGAHWTDGSHYMPDSIANAPTDDLIAVLVSRGVLTIETIPWCGCADAPVGPDCDEDCVKARPRSRYVSTEWTDES